MNYKVKNSHLYNIEEIKMSISILYNDNQLGKSRSQLSYVKEWYAHNVMYKLHLFRSHTKDVDLNDDETKFRLFIYNIIWLFRKRYKE